MVAGENLGCPEMRQDRGATGWGRGGRRRRIDIESKMTRLTSGPGKVSGCAQGTPERGQWGSGEPAGRRT